MELFFSISALVVSVVSVGVSVVTYLFGLRREKRQATLDAFSAFQKDVLDRLNYYRKTDIDDIAEDHLSPDYKDISGLLARCEHFAVGVNSHIYDRSTVRRLAGRYIIALYDKMEPLIAKKRCLNSTERHYKEFERLANKLKQDYRFRCRSPRKH